jgi:ubiquinone/menaquinone biosynthesis C-methylase UbiE
MGLYATYLVPRLVDLACGAPTMARWRERVCAGLSGTVVEPGFGTGHNVPFYPDPVTEVLAVEPSDLSMRLASKRIASSPVAIRRVGLDGGALELDDDSCDHALITFTLCTVSDPALALSEVKRVLRPGGTLHFLEHGLAPDARIARWQRRLDPFERRLADGCHLTRDPKALVESSGFSLEWLEQRFARGPKPWSFFSVGVARASS